MHKRTLFILVKSLIALCAVLLSLFAFLFHPAHAARAYDGAPIFIPTSEIKNNNWTILCSQNGSQIGTPMAMQQDPRNPISTVNPPVDAHGYIGPLHECSGSFIYANATHYPSTVFYQQLETELTTCEIATWIPELDNPPNARFDVWGVANPNNNPNGVGPGWIVWPGTTFNLSQIDSSQIDADQGGGWLLITPPIDITHNADGSLIGEDTNGKHVVRLTLNTEDDTAPPTSNVALDAVAFKCS